MEGYKQYLFKFSVVISEQDILRFTEITSIAWFCYFRYLGYDIEILNEHILDVGSFSSLKQHS